MSRYMRYRRSGEEPRLGDLIELAYVPKTPLTKRPMIAAAKGARAVVCGIDRGIKRDYIIVRWVDVSDSSIRGKQMDGEYDIKNFKLIERSDSLTLRT